MYSHIGKNEVKKGRLMLVIDSLFRGRRKNYNAITDNLPEPSRCWVDTDSVSPASNHFLRLQSAIMLLGLSWRILSFISINLCLHMIKSDHWPDYVNLYQHHQKCAVMILSNLVSICILCENMDVRTSTCWYAFSCLYIWLLYRVS